MAGRRASGARSLAATLALAAVAVLMNVHPATAADLTQVPTSSTTLPPTGSGVQSAAVPKITVPTVTVPPVGVTVPKVPVTVSAPTVDLGTSGTPSAPPAGAGGGPAPATATGSAPSSGIGSTVAPGGVVRAAGDRRQIGPAAGGVDPAARALAFRLRRAAAETLQQLTFPLGLMLAMGSFLVFQHRLDKNDPRVAATVISGDDDLLDFS
ncbi:MAG TPA: hypothetical protein VMZ51_05590 [Acidimicrobiales bacterium]|nr:hypothetical protein [Acidimicrobiales bacterium]